MTVRKVIFWLHLIVGIAAGIIILIMSVTGVLLAYEKQIVAWLDRGYLTEGSPLKGPRAPAEAIVSTIRTASGAAPTTVTFYSGAATVSAAAGGSTYYVNAHTGELLGASSTRVRSFFRRVTDWHRYIAMSGDDRATGKSITGAANLLFLFIVASGAFLWWRGMVLWFKRRLSGKALYWNWHNVFGAWALLPLFLVVLSATVISYPWATDLVYTLTSSQAPPQGGGRGGGQNRAAGEAPRDLHGIDAALARVEQTVPGWRTIGMRLPSAKDSSLTFTVDRGTSGQPQFRSTVTVNRKSGEIASHERFEDQNLGRRTRSWLRFVHTGEYYGIAGQTLAGVASFAGVMLVFTGFALSLQRLAAWIRRLGKTVEPAEAETQPSGRT